MNHQYERGKLYATLIIENHRTKLLGGEWIFYSIILKMKRQAKISITHTI